MHIALLTAFALAQSEPAPQPAAEPAAAPAASEQPAAQEASQQSEPPPQQQSAEKKKGVAVGFGIAPIIGMGILSGTGDKAKVNFTLGARTQLNYRSRSAFGIDGSIYVRYFHMFGGDRFGDDLKMGTVIGPKLSIISVLIGAEVQYTQYGFVPELYPWTWSLGIPMRLALDVKVVSAYFGVVPSWYLGGNPNNRQPTDWSVSKAPGFGDEFEWQAGVGVRLGPIKLGLSSETRVGDWGSSTQVMLGSTYSFHKKGK